MKHKLCGFTLVELLIVFSITGMLVSLLLPAVQASREAARRSDCQNNLHQIGLAFQLHEAAHRTFPTNGWGYLWIGDPDKGYGTEQPGGWIFNILEYLEQGSVRNISAGLPTDSPMKRTALAEMLQTPVTGLNCVSRRPNILRTAEIEHFNPRNSDKVTWTVRSDYAANAGDLYKTAPSDNDGEDYDQLRSGDCEYIRNGAGPESVEDAGSEKWTREFSRLADVCNGVVYAQSIVAYKDLRGVLPIVVDEEF